MHSMSRSKYLVGKQRVRIALPLSEFQMPSNENLHLGVCVTRRHHLRKVNEDRFAFVRHENVEFVKIRVNQSMLGQLDGQVHEVRVEFARVQYLGDLAQGVTSNQSHDDAVPVEINGLRNGESIVVKDLHKGKFSHGSQARQVEPMSSFPLLQVVSLFLDSAEGRATQTVDLEHTLVAVLVRNDVNVRLFAYADLIADRVNRVSLYESV